MPNRCPACHQPVPPFTTACPYCGEACAQPAGSDMEQFERELTQLVADGRKLEAIKQYRERTGCGLRDSKEAVEQLAVRQGVITKSSGCASVLLLLLMLAASLAWILCGTASLRAAEEPPALIITQNTVLDPAKTYGRIEIQASGVTIDGRGAWLIGASEGDPREFKGTAVSAKNMSRVTLRNLNAKGWETGLHIESGDNWLVEHCDFSDNFHDPSFDWGENGRRGGIVLERVTQSTLQHNRANRVWDACVLVDSHENRILSNDFSHTSNTCLKLWTACKNHIEKNNLSYGLRIKPGEVHARDSTSVLLESGSNGNHFLENDCTHGGDGVFVRSLNGWVSSDNVFEGNDASYAHNNCFEAWCPRNKYIRNKANHGSYGFWLGASDETVLIENEASYNGLPSEHHNSPHLPDATHAGIVFMFGPSSHTLVRGNTCVGNNGAGIALIGDQPTKGQAWRAFHWIIEQNTFRENRWGIYAQYADWIDVAANVFDKNEHDLFIAEGVTNLTQRPDGPSITQPPRAIVTGPSFSPVGQEVVLDASASTDPSGHPLTFRWDLGDGTISDQARVTHTFRSPGFHRVGVTVNNGLLSDLGWREFYVVDGGEEWGTDRAAAAWSWVDPASKVQFTDDSLHVAGENSLHAAIHPYGGMLVKLLYPRTQQANVSLVGKRELVFWIRATNANLPAWQGPQPIITLHESAETFATLTPTTDLLSARPNNEEREGWTYLVVPLAGNDKWKREGEVPATLNYLTIGFDSWGAPPLDIWLDGMSIR